MFRELRRALRLLLRSPGYTATILAILALAIGANTAIFAVVQGVLLKPLPLRAPQELVVVWEADPARNLPVVELTYRRFEQWSAHARSFAAVAVMGSSTWKAVLRGRGAPVRLASAGVSATFFDTLGAVPSFGRTLRQEDDRPNAPPVAVLSHASWVQYFGADPAVVGSTAQFDTTRTIVGVMPPEFDFPRGTSFWFPVLPLLSSVSRPGFDALASVRVLYVVGRLRSGVSRSVAAEELDRVARAADGTRASGSPVSASVVTPFLDYLLGPVRRGLWALWSAVGLLLLVACANVSALMMTRAGMRRREHAVRVALGATRARIAHLWLSEAAILAAAGGALGFVAASWMTKGVIAVAPPDVPRLMDVTISPTIALFTAAVVLIVAVLCGLGPAREAATLSVIEGLNDAAHTTFGLRRGRSQSAIVALQIALSVVLLVSAGLILRSFAALRQLDLGFVPADVLTLFVESGSNDWMRELLRDVEGLPGVQAAGAVYLRPLELGPIGQETSVRLTGQTDAAARRNPALNFQVATPGYFRATRMRLVRGRFFSDEDQARAIPVAIVGESAARRLWPGEDALGQRLLLRDQREWRTVVGVVGDVHYRGLGDIRLDVYEPALQSGQLANYLAVRTSSDPLASAAAVQAEARRLNPAVVVDAITTLETIVSRAVAPWRFTSWLLACLASTAFLLTTVGLFGMVRLDVSSRQHELAIRRVLGAQHWDLLRSVLVTFLWHGVAGIVAGALGAVILSGTLRTLLFGIEPLDAATWLAVLATIAGAVAVAAWIPARRAGAVDPLTLLRR